MERKLTCPGQMRWSPRDEHRLHVAVALADGLAVDGRALLAAPQLSGDDRVDTTTVAQVHRQLACCRHVHQPDAELRVHRRELPDQLPSLEGLHELALELVDAELHDLAVGLAEVLGACQLVGDLVEARPGHGPGVVAAHDVTNDLTDLVGQTYQLLEVKQLAHR